MYVFLFSLNEQFEPFDLYNKSFFPKVESDFIHKELQTLLLLGHIEQCEKKTYFVSPIKCIPNKRGFDYFLKIYTFQMYTSQI